MHLYVYSPGTFFCPALKSEEGLEPLVPDVFFPHYKSVKSLSRLGGIQAHKLRVAEQGG